MEVVFYFLKIVCQYIFFFEKQHKTCKNRHSFFVILLHMVSDTLDAFYLSAMEIPRGSRQVFSADILPVASDAIATTRWKQIVRALESEGRVVSAITPRFASGVYCADGLLDTGCLQGWGLEEESPNQVLVQHIGIPFRSILPEAPNTTQQGLKLKPHHTMAVCLGTKPSGWGEFFFVPSGGFSMMIADTSGIQYGQSAFEGACAMRNKKQEVFAFRIDQNATRFTSSIDSLDLPKPEVASVHAAINQTIAENIAYVPAFGEGKLYIRPSVCGLSGGLGVIVPDYFLITIEVAAFGDYLPPSIRVEARLDVARPATGSTKIAPNYGGSYRIKHGVKSRGFDDYLSFDANGNAEEVATCAAGFVDADGNFVFPPVRGEIDMVPRNILPSITRKSTIDILKSMGKTVIIKDVHFSQLEAMQCMFTMGNAVGVLYVSEICLRENDTDAGQSIVYTSESARQSIMEVKEALYSARVGGLAGFEHWVEKIA